MKRGETIASARVIGPLLALDEEGEPVEGEDFDGEGELEVSIDGAAFAATEGEIMESGGGYYSLAPTDAEAAAAQRWLAVKLAGVCEEFTLAESVEASPQGITVGETDALKRRIGPLSAVDEDGEDLNDGDGIVVEVIINGGTLTEAAGELVFGDDGYPYYVADPSELTERGWIAVVISGACEEFCLRQDVVAAAPAITVVSPTPGVAPGQPGGLPADWSSARFTPVVLDIDGDGLAFACVVARYPDDNAERVVYRRGLIRAGFTAESDVEQVTATKLRLTVLPDEGWPSLRALTAIEFDVDAIAGGELSDEAASS